MHAHSWHLTELQAYEGMLLKLVCVCVSWKIEKDKVGQRFKSTTWACVSVPSLPLCPPLCPPRLLPTSSEPFAVSKSHYAPKGHFIEPFYYNLVCLCNLWFSSFAFILKKERTSVRPCSGSTILSITSSWSVCWTEKTPRPARLKRWPSGIRFYNSNRTRRFLLMYTQTQPNSTEGSKKWT